MYLNDERWEVRAPQYGEDLLAVKEEEKKKLMHTQDTHPVGADGA